MCGIFGYSHYGKTPMGNLHHLATRLGFASTERGTHATGIAFKDTKGNLTISKKAVPAWDFDFNVVRGASVVMGHTRHATQGDKHDNYNNHPFVGRGKNTGLFAFAHNGMIHNDWTLRKTEQIKASKIKTDSYIACQLVEKYGGPSIESIAKMSEKIEGSFNFTFLDNNNTLYFSKGSNPLVIAHFPALSLYVYASTEEILFEALGQFEPTQKVIISAFRTGNTKNLTLINPNAGDILVITADGNTTEGSFQYDPSSEDSYWRRYTMSEYSYPSNSYKGTRTFGSSNADFRNSDLESLNSKRFRTDKDLIYEYAEYAGITRADVDDLFNDGHTVESLEEAITNGTIHYMVEMLHVNDVDEDNVPF